MTLARPEFLEAHPTWGAGLRNFTQPAPRTAARRDHRRPARRRSCRACPPAAARRIAARAEGVPLYAVETLRMLLAQGVLTRRRRDGGGFRLVGDLADVAVPDSLRGLIAARLDLLPTGGALAASRMPPCWASPSTGGTGGRDRPASPRPSTPQAARARPPRAAAHRVGPPLARARPVHLGAGRASRGRLRDALEARSTGPPPGRGALLRHASVTRNRPASWPTTTSRPGAPRPSPMKRRRSPGRPAWRCEQPPSAPSGCATSCRRHRSWTAAWS